MMMARHKMNPSMMHSPTAAATTASSSSLALDPDAVRRRASSIIGCVEVVSSTSTINKKKSPTKLLSPKSSNANTPMNTTISFLVGVTGNSNSTSMNRGASFGSTTNNKVMNAATTQRIDDLARITIYCDTGTVATGRFLNGKIRHTYRRNVTSLDVVERCLKYPATLPQIDWQLVSMTDTNTNIENNYPMDHYSKNNGNNDVERTIKKNLELCDVGLAILQSEREKLVLHANSIRQYKNSITTSSNDATTPSTQPQQSIHNKGAAVPSNATNNVSSKKPTAVPQHHPMLTPSSCPTSGMEFQFSLAERPMKHVDQCLTDIQKMNKIVHAVSTNGIGTVFLYGNGGVAYTPNIPRTLYQKLSQLRYSKIHSSRPQYVSLGSRERYFVAFHDGTVSYKGPKGLDKELRKLTPPSSSATTSTTPTSTSSSSFMQQQNSITNKLPSSTKSGMTASTVDTMQPSSSKQLWPLRSVAFGSSYDTFCIVFQDGTYSYQGKSFPKELEEILLSTTAAANNNSSHGDDFNDTIVLSSPPSPSKSPFRKGKKGGNAPANVSTIETSAAAAASLVVDDNDNGDDYPLDHYYNKMKANERAKQTSIFSNSFSTSKVGNNSVTCINLGPSGEWFLRTENGRMEWGGISEEMDEAIQQLLDDGHRLNYFDFGEDSSYFVSYD